MMSMYSTTLRVGEAVEIGEVAAVRVEAKSGCMVKLAFFTELPLRTLVDGIIPPRYVYGISGEPRCILEPVNGRGGPA
jgi:hypothetical protein